MEKLDILRASIEEKSCVKVIAGIDNFDIEKVLMIVNAASQGGATCVDISAQEEIVKTVRKFTKLPVFVSSIDPEKLAAAYQYGADVLEIGNYDAIYKKGMRITAKQVLNLAEITISLVGNEALLCVTVPGHIDIKEQIELAQKLEELEIDLIQTEGSVISEVKSSGARGLIEKALVSIANTLELSRNVDIPIMTSSGITPATAPMAFAAGASAVGVGSCVNRLSSSIEMIATVRSVVEASTPCIMHISDEELYI